MVDAPSKKSLEYESRKAIMAIIKKIADDENRRDFYELVWFYTNIRLGALAYREGVEAWRALVDPVVDQGSKNIIGDLTGAELAAAFALGGVMQGIPSAGFVAYQATRKPSKGDKKYHFENTGK